VKEPNWLLSLFFAFYLNWRQLRKKMFSRMKIYSSLMVSLGFFLLFSCETETKRMNGFSVHGLDVSHYQKLINWDTVMVHDIDFVFIKASEGENFRDSFFQNNWNALAKFDIKKGAYHFFRPTLDVNKQFQNFSETVKLASEDLPPVLDIEVKDGKSKQEIIKAVKQWLSLAEKKYKIKPIIYTNLNF